MRYLGLAKIYKALEANVGLTRVTVTVRNAAELDREWSALFMVDTGALDCLIPGVRLREIGIEPRSKRVYSLADGTEITLDVAGAELEVLGERVFTQVAFGPDDVEPLLGVLALEALGIEVNPQTQELRRVPTLSMKRRGSK